MQGVYVYTLVQSAVYGNLWAQAKSSGLSAPSHVFKKIIFSFVKAVQYEKEIKVPVAF